LVAAGGAWFAAGAATRSVWLRAWVALTWLVAPPLWTALSSGRLGAVVAHAALPWAALMVARAIGVNRLDVRPAVIDDARDGPQGPAASPGSGSAQAAAVGGLAFAVVAAGSPVALAPGLVALVVLAALAGRGRRLLLVWAALPALALFAPLIWDVVRGGSWRQLVADPGPVAAYEPASFPEQLLGFAASPDLGWLGSGTLAPVALAAVAGAPVVAAVAALVRRGSRGRAVRFGWLVALLGAAGILGADRLVVAADGLAPAHPWVGSLAGLVLLGCLLAGAVGLSGLVGERAATGARWRAGAAAAGVAVLLTGPALGGALAVRERWQDSDLRRSQTAPVPAIAQEGAAGPLATSTLFLSRPQPAATEQRVEWELSRGAGRQLSDPEGVIGARGLTGLPGAGSDPDQADQRLDAAVAAIAARNPGAAALELTEAGIGFVVAPVADLGLAAALDATAGLARTSQSDQGVVWRVAPSGLELDGREADAPARLRIETRGRLTAVESAPGVRIQARLAPSTGAGRLVLAERASAGWHATLDGEALTAVSDGWSQTFDLPAGGGELRVWHAEPWALGAVQALIIVLAALVALPTRRGASEEDES
jgi:hypothetical protein